MRKHFWFAAAVLAVAGCLAGEIGFSPVTEAQGGDGDADGEGAAPAGDSGIGEPTEESGSEDEPSAGEGAGATDPDVAGAAEDPLEPSEESFRFVAWGDTKTDTDVLAELSPQVREVGPSFSVYAGDLVPDGFDESAGTEWKEALNGWADNRLFDITYAMRGNHEREGSEEPWAAFFDFEGVAARVGSSRFSEQGEDLNYSFDHGNAHFVMLDVLGSVERIGSEELEWMDRDLSSAAARGLTHAFLFWHGPIYQVANHCCSTNEEVTEVINRHPIVSASFHGHEHTHAWVHIDEDRVPGTTHEFEQFIAGAAGAGPTECEPGRTDYCQDEQHGFAAVTVAGRDFTVDFHVLGEPDPVYSLRFTKP
ncbi:MAG: hypothetical protein HYY06_14780 [Deltaproteobacteria bacterium]|nr:hypothetical protein [Deltaproteobacteria bacterium]